MVQVKVSPEMGRGLYADKIIHNGTIVMLCELLVLDQVDTFKVNDTALKHYTFKFNENQDCIVLGLGEIFNHDDKPNVSYRVVFQDDRYFMEFKALSHIEAGCQLFIDYKSDSMVNVSEYIEQFSLIG